MDWKLQTELNLVAGAFFFIKVAGLEPIPAISLKETPPQRFSYVCSAR